MRRASQARRGLPARRRCLVHPAERTPTGPTPVLSWNAARPCVPQRRALILNRMVQLSKTAQLDAAFAALSDATRRGVLEQLGRADASITDLAKRFDMTLTGMKKHVRVLEDAGLVATAKVGRVRSCKLGRRRLDEVTAWIDRYRQMWSARFDELDQVIEDMKQQKKERKR